MTFDDSQRLLKEFHESRKKPRTDPKDDMEYDTFPMHAIWNSFAFGSDAHYAVSKALGMGMDKEVTSVSRSSPVFNTLIRNGLIDHEGHASAALKAEVESKKKRAQTAKEILDPEQSGIQDKNTRDNMAALAMMVPDAECYNCASKGIRSVGPMMSKCSCGIYFG